MYLVDLRFGWKLWWSILFSIMLIVGWTITPAEAHCKAKGPHSTEEHCLGGGGGGGGGDPTAADPAIVYVINNSSVGHWGDLMAMDADGANQTTVIDGGASRPVSPSWSPDSSSLVFSHMFAEPCSGVRLEVVSLDENNQWGSPVALECRGWEPAWSPDNSDGVNKVAYTGFNENPGDDQDLFLIEFTSGLNGIVTSPRQALTDTPDIHEGSPTWSPDGSELAVLLQPLDWPNTDIDIVVLDPNDASNRRSLVPSSSPLKGAVIRGISWAKSHDLLVVQADNDLWCIDTFDGSQATNLTQTPEEREFSSNWSPDDSEIIYSVGGRAIVVEIVFSGGGCQAVPDTMREIANIGKRKSISDLKWRR